MTSEPPNHSVSLSLILPACSFLGPRHRAFLFPVSQSLHPSCLPCSQTPLLLNAPGLRPSAFKLPASECQPSSLVLPGCQSASLPHWLLFSPDVMKTLLCKPLRFDSSLRGLLEVTCSLEPSAPSLGHSCSSLSGENSSCRERFLEVEVWEEMDTWKQQQATSILLAIPMMGSQPELAWHPVVHSAGGRQVSLSFVSIFFPVQGISAASLAAG